MRTTSNVSRRIGILSVVALVAGLVALDAHAQNIVYHSPNDDGVNPGSAAKLTIGPGNSLFLYLDTGSAITQNGIACSDGDGRETCGYETFINALGQSFFVDFIPEPGVVYRLVPKEIQINGLFALNPAVGAVRIGELKVASSDALGAVMVMGGEVVLAALQTEPVSQTLMAEVPEPSGWLPLAVGAALLIGLRNRERRARPRDPSETSWSFDGEGC
jgi:hypothetical protein